MGSHIHAVAAAGGAAVHDLGEELDEDCSWLEIQQQQQQQPQSQQQPGDQQQQQSEQQHDHKHWPLFHHKQQQQQQVLSSSSTSAAGHEPWPLPPLKVLSSSHSRKAWQHATPVMLQVRAWGQGRGATVVCLFVALAEATSQLCCCCAVGVDIASAVVCARIHHPPPNVPSCAILLRLIHVHSLCVLPLPLSPPFLSLCRPAVGVDSAVETLPFEFNRGRPVHPAGVW